MQFTVPQFIERKPKIIGPMTFGQFIFVGTAGGICLFLYFIIPMSLFVVIAIFLMGGSAALAFVKIGKDPLPIVIRNFFIYSFHPKIYLWKKKNTPIKIHRTFEKGNYHEKKVEIDLKISTGSKLEKLLTKIQNK